MNMTATPTNIPPGWALVPIVLPPLAVSEIKDLLESEYQCHLTQCRPLWASLLKIVAGLSIESQERLFVAERGRAPAPLPALAAAPAARMAAQFQQQVEAWAGECFPAETVHNLTERGDRVLEEVLELLQSHGYDRARVATLVDYVYSRPVGEPSQEVGGVMVTLALYCAVAGLDMQWCGDTELARINAPNVMEKIRAKQAAKNALHFDTPLPGNAATPAVEVDEAMVELVCAAHHDEWHILDEPQRQRLRHSMNAALAAALKREG